MEKHSESFQLVLFNQDGLGRITVDLEAFFEFSFALADDLVRLQAKYPRPNASKAAAIDRR